MEGLRDESRHLRGFVKIIRDITEWRLAEDELDRMQVQLSNILEAVETLRDVDTSNVSPTASVKIAK